MQATVAEFVDSIVQFPFEIYAVASQSPITAALVVLGALMVFAAMAVFGYLSLGAVVSLVTPN